VSSPRPGEPTGEINSLDAVDKIPVILRGEIRTGKGDFSFWIDELLPCYTRNTGMRLFPRTLNVHLTSGSYCTPANAMLLEKEEYGGRVSVSIVP
jgi:riboflavin kinase, archaea type